MAIVEPGLEITPEQFLDLPDAEEFELIDGELVRREMGSQSSWSGGKFYRFLDEYAERTGLGWVWPADNGFRCFPHAPKRVRRPDASFVRAERLPGPVLPGGFLTIAPDLVVEVTSPNERMVEVAEKVEDYLRAGVPLVWVFVPEARIGQVIRADGTAAWLREGDAFDGEAVVPGFRLPLSKVMPPSPAQPPASGSSGGAGGSSGSDGGAAGTP